MIGDKKVVIAVPSYKCRHTELISNLKNISDKYDKLVVLSDNDPDISKYDEFKNDNVKFVTVHAENLAQKRQRLLDTCHDMGYDVVVQVDDDIRYKGLKITPETKRTTSNSYRKIEIPFEELCDTLVEGIDKYNAGFVSTIFPIYIAFSQPGKVNINRTLHCSSLICVDLNQIYDNGICYDETMSVTEDLCLCIRCLINGIKCVTLGDITFDQKGTIYTAASAEFDDLNARYRTALGDNKYFNIPLRLDKKGHLKRYIKWENYWNAKNMPKFKNWVDEDIHQMIIDGCNANAVIDYIKENWDKRGKKKEVL